MVWRAPRIWIDGPHITAAQMNAVSENLRETAPAKAVAAGDLFYATGRNAIERLALGLAGTFLIPGQAAPQWSRVPTPITTQGDLVAGDASGDPSRLPAVERGVLIAQGGVVSWEGDDFLNKWWEWDAWWSLDPNDDMVLVDGDTFPQGSVLGRDLSIGGSIACLASPAVLRFKKIVLTADTTIRCLNSFDEGYAEQGLSSFAPNPGGAGSDGVFGGTSDSGGSGSPGSFLCGGGGGGRGASGSGSFTLNGSPGTDSSQSYSVERITDLDTSHVRTSGGGKGGRGGWAGAGLPGNGGNGGGVVLIATQSIDLQGHTLSIDASGESGEPGRSAGSTFGGTGGAGGGGAIIVIIQNGVPSITTDVTGGASAGPGGDGVVVTRTSF